MTRETLDKYARKGAEITLAEIFRAFPDLKRGLAKPAVARAFPDLKPGLPKATLTVKGRRRMTRAQRARMSAGMRRYWANRRRNQKAG